MKNFFKDFKKFISKGNVLDLAVATIIGAAFGSIVTSFTNGIIMPLISLLFKAENLDKLVITLRPAELDPATQEVVKEAVTWQYGTLIQAVINFLIIALFLFILIKLITRVQQNLDLNKKMTEIVQKKLDKDEPLTKLEEKWLKRYTKSEPDLAPKKKEPEVVAVEPEPEPELSSTDKLLTEILTELKKDKQPEKVE